jgi:hypothetical protein
MQYPYTEVQPGRFRPIILLHIRGPIKSILTDGLLDSGADRTILSPRTARSIGIDVNSIVATISVRVPVGPTLKCKVAKLPLELLRAPDQICWLGEVAVPLTAVHNNYWGFKGFLEYFRAEFDGPNRMITLTPGSNLPAVTPL